MANAKITVYQGLKKFSAATAYKSSSISLAAYDNYQQPWVGFSAYEQLLAIASYNKTYVGLGSGTYAQMINAQLNVGSIMDLQVAGSFTGYADYSAVSLLSYPVVYLFNVDKIKNLASLFTSAYYYPAQMFTGVQTASTYPYQYTHPNTVYTKDQFIATFGEYYVISSYAIYNNTNDGAITSSSPRTVLSGNYHAFLRASWNGVQYYINPSLFRDYGYGDMLMPIFENTVLSKGNLYPPSLYMGNEIGASSFFGTSSNTAFNTMITGSNTLWKAFPSLSLITNYLNKVGIPFTYDSDAAQFKNTSTYTDFVPSGQPTDVTTGGNGTGDNNSDSITQVDPAITPIASFNRQYAVSQSMLNIFSNYLWNSTFLDNIKLLYNNPAEGVVSCKMFPFAFDAHDPSNLSSATPIVIGNVTTTASGYPILSPYSCRFDLGSFTIEEYYGTAMDYEPYTTIQIFLPYIGIKTLSTNDVMGQTISVRYVIDITTGACVAEIWRGQQLIYTFDGKIGIDIPISSTNAAQFASTTALTAASGVAGIATGIASGNPLIVAGSVLSTAKNVASNQMHINKGGVNSPTVGLYLPQYAYLIFERPIQSLASTFGTIHGFPCNVSKLLSAVTGYTEIESPILTSITAATEEEKTQIKSLLESGVIL